MQGTTPPRRLRFPNPKQPYHLLIADPCQCAKGMIDFRASVVDRLHNSTSNRLACSSKDYRRPQMIRGYPGLEEVVEINRCKGRKRLGHLFRKCRPFTR